MDGLTVQEVEYRIDNNLVNNKNIKYSRSIKQIFLSNIFTIFNIINTSLLILVLTTGSLQNTLFIGNVIFNTAIAIYQEIKAKTIMDKLTISNQQKVKVKREGRVVEITPEEIVLDDILVLSSGDDVLVDSKVIASSLCEVDESVITGESNGVIKKEDDELISGTVIISGSCLARVMSVGSDNYASNLIEKANVIRDNSSYLKQVINKILKIITFCIVPTTILLFISQYFLSNQSYKEAILSIVAGVIGMIPSGLVLLTSLALTVGVIRIAKKKVIVQRLHGIEVLSCVDVLCLDKTGTITDGSMEVIEVVNVYKDYDIGQIISNMIFEDSLNATDMALKNYFKEPKTYEVKERIAFSSLRKYSLVSFKDHNTFALGALEYITKEKITKYDSYLLKYINGGYRIITLVHSLTKELTNAKVIGFVILRDNIRKNAKETLEYFKEQEVELKIISGDNPLTVSNIMRQLKFDNYDKYIEGSELPEDYNMLIETVKKYSIFGRTTPYQKQQIVKALKQTNTVGMIGDGVNDILALKEANCGIALASGISAARSVSEVVLTTSDFGVLPSIVNEGRRVVNNIERVASLYLIKTTYSFILSLLSIVLSHEYPFYPVQLSLISATCVGIPSFVLAIEPNKNKVKPGFIRKVFRNALPSGLCVFFNIFLIIMFCSIFGKDFENYRLVIVAITGLINLRLLYNVCKPLSLVRRILVITCAILFFSLLFLLPNFFLVPKISIGFIIFFILLAYMDIYVIEFLEDIYDKIFVKTKGK